MRPVRLVALLWVPFALEALPAAGQPTPLDAHALATGPYGHMSALLEKTIFNVDVLTLDLCVDPPTAQGLSRVVTLEVSREEREDSVTRLVMNADEALARIRFERGISLDQFLDGIDEDQKKAVDAGLLADSTRRALRAALPVWYTFLEERRIQEGDLIFYRFTSDTLRVTYLDPAAGEVLLDHTTTGEQRRASVLATYFAPDGSFRRRLVASLMETHQQAPTEAPLDLHPGCRMP